MDKLYIGDIPLNYCYARFADGHIDLYNTNHIEPNTAFDYYRIYTYDTSFYYERFFGTSGASGSTISTKLDVTDDWFYRRDFPSIVFLSVVYCCILIILFNIVSSVFKKGGLLSGLL